MREKGVAKRYALAFVESAQGAGILEALGAELEAFAQVYAAHESLRKVLMNPAVSIDAKKGIVGGVLEAMKLSKGIRDVCNLLVEKGRMNVVTDVAESYHEIMDERLGRVKVHITSAQPLDKTDQAKLEKAFAVMTKKKVKVETATDSSLMAGIVARIGSKVYDGSLSNQLRLMKTKLEGEA